MKEITPGSMQGIRGKVTCRDGFSVSIQASKFHYCEPREDGHNKYNSFELGFPNMREKMLMKYAEDKDKPTETVYGYVPFKVVNKLIQKHGGIEDEKMS